YLRSYIFEEFIIKKLGKKIDGTYRFFVITFDNVGLFYLFQQLNELIVCIVQYRCIINCCMAENTPVRQRIAAIGIELHHMWLYQETQVGVFAKRVYQFMRLRSINLLHLTTVVSKK